MKELALQLCLQMKLIHFQLCVDLIYSASLAHIWLDSLQSIHFLLCFVWLSQSKPLPNPLSWPYLLATNAFSYLLPPGMMLVPLFPLFPRKGTFCTPGSKWQRHWLLLAYVFTQSFRYRLCPSFNLNVGFRVKGFYPNPGYWFLRNLLTYKN